MTANKFNPLKGEIVRIQMTGKFSSGCFRQIRFSRFGTAPDDRHGFYGYAKRWDASGQKFYWDSSESFHDIPA